MSRRLSAEPVSNRRWRAPLRDHVIDLRWSPDGALLAAAAVDGEIALLDGATGLPVAGLPRHRNGASAVAWHPGGELLATGGQDGTVRLLGRDGEVRAEAPAGASWVERLAWSPAGDLLAVAAGRRVRALGPDGRVVHESVEHPSTVVDVAWRPKGRELASAAYGGVRLWRPGSAETRLLEWKGSVLRLAWSPDGRFLATGDQDATVHLWPIPSGRDLMMSGFQVKVRELAWDGQGRWLATGGSDEVGLWDCSGRGPEGRRPVLVDPGGGRVSAIAFEARGPRLAAGTDEGRLVVQRAGRRGKPILAAVVDEAVATLAWAPSGALLAVGDAGGGVTAFELPPT